MSYSILAVADANALDAVWQAFDASIDGNKAEVAGWQVIQFGETGGKDNANVEVLAGGSGDESQDRHAVRSFMDGFGWMPQLVQVRMEPPNSVGSNLWMSMEAAKAQYGVSGVAQGPSLGS